MEKNKSDELNPSSIILLKGKIIVDTPYMYISSTVIPLL